MTHPADCPAFRGALERLVRAAEQYLDTAPRDDTRDAILRNRLGNAAFDGRQAIDQADTEVS